jgi:hypothetical protein
MLNSISKFGSATEKFSNIAGVLNTANPAVLNKQDNVCDEALKTEFKAPEAKFKFSRPTIRKSTNFDEVMITEAVVDDETAELDTYTDEVFIDEDINQPMFKSGRVQDDLLVEWEIQAEDGPDICSDEDLEAVKSIMPPLLLGFDTQNYFVELEYMVIAGPETGKSVSPEVSVKPSLDNKSGEIYLNGKLVACVEGAQDLLAQDVVLIKVEA